HCRLSRRDRWGSIPPDLIRVWCHYICLEQRRHSFLPVFYSPRLCCHILLTCSTHPGLRNHLLMPSLQAPRKRSIVLQTPFVCLWLQRCSPWLATNCLQPGLTLQLTS